MEWYEKYIPTKSVSYKCYTATYYKDTMYDMEFHNLEIWKTDYKKDTAFMVIHATLGNEPTEEELLEHIKHYIKNKNRR